MLFTNALKELNSDWQNLLEPYLKSNRGKTNLRKIDSFLENSGGNFHPPVNKLLAPFHSTNLSDIKVIIVGHYPYPSKHQTTGLPFSNPQSMKMSLSVRTIYEAVINDLGGTMPINGSLDHLPPQGVFLINRKFTTGEPYNSFPNGHSNIGWENFSESIIYLLSKELNKAAFLLWGNSAKEVKRWIQPKHLSLTSTHPSFKPTNKPNPFLNCCHFSKTNAFITKNNISNEIKWLPN